MTDELINPPPTPWWHSRTVWAAVGAVIPQLWKLAARIGIVPIYGGEDGQILADIWTLVMGVLAVKFRWSATGPLASDSVAKGFIHRER